MTENTPSDALELWRDALTAPHLGKFGHDDQAAAAVIADALAEWDAEIARIVAWIRTGAMFAYTDQEMADAIEAGEWK